MEPLKADETYLAKLRFITENNVVAFHFHDHWHARRPDGINAGMARELRWDKNADPENARIYPFNPVQSLTRLARNIEQKLNARTLRILCYPQLPIQRVYTSWGMSVSLRASITSRGQRSMRWSSEKLANARLSNTFRT